MGDFFALRYGGVLLKGPSADGSAGQFLQTDGSGNLSFATVNTDATALASGSVVFSDGSTLSEDSANLFWDSTNQRLGVGTTTPTTAVHIDAAKRSHLFMEASQELGSQKIVGYFAPQDHSIEFGCGVGIGPAGTKIIMAGSGYDTPSTIEMTTNDTIRLAIDSNGDITTGGASGQSKLHVISNNIGGARAVIIDADGESSDEAIRVRSNTTPSTATDSNTVAILTSQGYLGLRDSTPTSKLHISGDTASDVQSIIQAAASQTANLTEWQDSAGGVLAGHDANGYNFTRLNSAPADASIAASEAKYWFDDTNASASFNVKAKQADGTVVTGSISLT